MKLSKATKHILILVCLFILLLSFAYFFQNLHEGYMNTSNNTKVDSDNQGDVAVITKNGQVYTKKGNDNDNNNNNNDNNNDNNNGNNSDDDSDDESNAAEVNTYYGAYGNSATVAKGPRGNTAVSTNDQYPNAIRRANIPPGDEDLYILKSEIVPPVCPACPPVINNTPTDPSGNTSDSDDDNSNKDTSKCPPCPACARCPEPAFECKKIPSYSKNDNKYLPKPILNDFSTFGM